MIKNDNDSCQLLALPAELWNRIYGFALVEDEPITVSETYWVRRTKASGKRVKRGKTQPIKEPGLLRTCQQVHVEAVAMYYGLNTFTDEMTLYLAAWLDAIGKEKTAMVKTVLVDTELQAPGDHYLARTAYEILKAYIQISGRLSMSVLRMPIMEDDKIEFVNEEEIKARMSDEDLKRFFPKG